MKRASKSQNVESKTDEVQIKDWADIVDSAYKITECKTTSKSFTDKFKKVPRSLLLLEAIGVNARGDRVLYQAWGSACEKVGHALRRFDESNVL